MFGFGFFDDIASSSDHFRVFESPVSLFGVADPFTVSPESSWEFCPFSKVDNSDSCFRIGVDVSVSSLLPMTKNLQ